MIALTAAQGREEFPGLAGSTYLISHSMGAAPRGAREALGTYWDEWSANGPDAWHEWLPRITQIADRLGSIFGAPAGSVYLAPNVSILQSAIASSLHFGDGRDEVVVDQLQFPSVSYVWKAWERSGARLTIVPTDDGRTVPTERITAAITSRTRVVVLSHAYFMSGALVDVPAIVARARDAGALVVLDAYQTTGVYPYDVVAYDVDFAVGGSHKWLCGGPGCGYIYVKPALLLEFEPSITGWMAHREPFAFEPTPIAYARDMSRWSTGTPTIPGYVAAAAGHDFILRVGVDAIRAHNVRLTSLIAERALERGFDVATPLAPELRTGWIGINFEGAERVYEHLTRERMFVDFRPRCGMRVGPHVYTTDAEIEAFFSAVDRIRTQVA